MDIEQNKELILESTKNVEKIKTGICNYINDVLVGSGSSSCTISVGRIKIDNVVAAKPYNRHSTSGIQPYVDIELIIANGNSILVGLRQRAENPFSKKLGRFAIPALEKGMWSLEKYNPQIRKHFVSSLLAHYTSKGFGHGSVVDQAYGIITDKKQKEEILLGSPALGGKVDYVFSIERPSFWYKGISIPPAKYGYENGRFTITFGKTLGVSAAEIMAKNEIYVWMSGSKGRTLYLGNDMVDRSNMPVILGPAPGMKKPFGGNIKAAINAAERGYAVFEIQDNERIFKLELKSKTELLQGTEKHVDNKVTQQTSQSVDDEDDLDISSRLPSRSRYSQSTQHLSTKHTLSFSEREQIIDRIWDSLRVGVYELYKTELDRDGEETIKEILRDEDDRTLQRFASEKPHRLAKELSTKNYFEFQ